MDLYNDLDDNTVPLELKIKDLEENIVNLTRDNSNLHKELAYHKHQFDEITKEKVVLEKNISKLFRTAKSEIERKDATIKQLQQENLQLKYPKKS